MKADYRIFLDACVLANFGVCDLLLRLSERPRLIVPHWSAEVLAETHRTQVDKLGWPVGPLTTKFGVAVALPLAAASCQYVIGTSEASLFSWPNPTIHGLAGFTAAMISCFRKLYEN